MTFPLIVVLAALASGAVIGCAIAKASLREEIAAFKVAQRKTVDELLASIAKQRHDQANEIAGREFELAAQRVTIERLKQGVCAKNAELGALQARVCDLQIENAALKDRERRMFGNRGSDGKFRAKQ